MSSGYMECINDFGVCEYKEYVNSYYIGLLNGIWISGTYMILAANMLHVLAALLYIWRSSAWYHDFCYRRTLRMHIYQEKDIITKEKYEKYKEELLKKVKY